MLGCCIRLKNSCVDARIEVYGELMKGDDNVEVVLGLSKIPP